MLSKYFLGKNKGKHKTSNKWKQLLTPEEGTGHVKDNKNRTTSLLLSNYCFVTIWGSTTRAFNQKYHLFRRIRDFDILVQNSF